ncbi:MAG TPA: phosphoenolpyruvate synthase, partial [Puia sp.]|nr:phosphoenolpyruvate synthase [Puia sp.]
NLQGLLHELSRANALEQEHLRAITALIRSSIEQGPVPEGMAVEVAARLDRFAGHTAFAVRSSATAEDLPTASFAGQQDSYLNIMGTTSVMQHIRRCWASLFTDRAVTYRMRNGFDHLSVRLAVIVQKMILPQAAGIMFTADPLTGNRKILSIEAVTGLADALVSGARNADSFKVHSGTVVDKRIAASHQEPAVLTDEDVIRLEMAGRKIEAHFNYPQDIEWCLGDALYIVQSRPITTLFPIPEVPDHKKHVFISVGHQQMMTDPMKPLGLSLWKLIAFRPMASAGGRLFVDVTASLFSPSARSALIQAMAAHDPLIEDALLTVVGRPDLIDSDSDNQDRPNPAPTSASSAGYPKIDPSLISELIGASRQSIEKLRNSIGAKCGPALFDFILEDIRELKQKIAGSQTLRIITAATHASSWLNDHMKAWLNEPRVADTLSQSVPNNVTAEMGLALMDVADVIRPYPELIDCLRRAGEGTFLRELLDLKGGRPARDAILRYLDKYGMRCPGEIDITRPRWAEQPAALIPMILSNVSNLESGEAKRKFEAGREQALKREGDLLERLKQLPDSDRKMEETRRMIDLLRNTAGYREYPKYDIVNHLFLYKQALMREAYQLAKNGLIREKEDIFYLTFDELREVVRTGRLDNELIALRKAEHAGFER